MSKIPVFVIGILLVASLLPSVSAHTGMDVSRFFYTSVNFVPSNTPSVGDTSVIIISILNATTGEPISSLDTVHERIMHVFLVGEDLETLFHIHPEDYVNGTYYQEFGVYQLAQAFEESGRYLLVADYTHMGQNVVMSFPFDVAGQNKMTRSPLSFERDGMFDGYNVSLQIPERIEAGNQIDMVYHIERDGEEIKDLQLYLGSEMHVLVVKDDLSKSGHTHVYIPAHALHFGSMTQRYYGPNIPIRYVFDRPGNYVIFGQFQHDGNVVTARFAVTVGENPFTIALSIVVSVVMGLFFFYMFKDELRFRKTQKSRRSRKSKRRR